MSITLNVHAVRAEFVAEVNPDTAVAELVKASDKGAEFPISGDMLAVVTRGQRHQVSARLQRIGRVFI